MEYITLKNSDLRVSRLCMGGCPMGGHGGGIVQEKDLIDAVHTALDQGVNFFDTADTYGLGQSELTLGRALEGRRDKAVIASKFGVRVENPKPSMTIPLGGFARPARTVLSGYIRTILICIRSTTGTAALPSVKWWKLWKICAERAKSAISACPI